MAVRSAQAAQPLRAGGLALTRHQLLRYAAALCGLVALVLFYQPWVGASLNAAGNTSLSGIELARGDASRRVNEAVFGGRTTGATSGAAITGAGGIVLPTRIPTVAPGGSSASTGGGATTAGSTAGGFGTSSGAVGGQATTVPGTAGQSAPVAAPGGVVIPTRVPTVAAGGSSGFGTTAGAAAQQTPLATVAATGQPAVAAAAPAAPPVLPTFWLHGIPLAALCLATVPVVWSRFTDQRDRSYGRAWTLLVSYGGTLFLGYVLWRITTSPSTNALLGPGVGSIQAALPALWGTFAGFLVAAVLLTVVWLLPSPPPPDPYGRPAPTT